MSPWASGVRCSFVLRCGAVVLRSMSRQRKVRPGWTTLAANDKLPMSDRSSLFLHWARRPQSPRIVRSAESLSAGRDNVHASESISIPSIFNWVAGPTTLSMPSETGMSRASKTANMVFFCIAVVERSGSGDGGPTVKKPSREFEVRYPIVVRQDELEAVGQVVEYGRCQAQAKWELQVDIVVRLPDAPEQWAVLRVNGDEPERAAQVHLRHKGPFSMAGHQCCYIVDRGVG